MKIHTYDWSSGRAVTFSERRASMKVKVDRGTNKTIYTLWCPACAELVCIDNTWEWNGDAERPTLTPSLRTEHTAAGQTSTCHAFVTDGEWHYLGDSTHDQAGRVVPMVDLPDWATDE